jgi:hypothetical protein
MNTSPLLGRLAGNFVAVGDVTHGGRLFVSSPPVDGSQECVPDVPAH